MGMSQASLENRTQIFLKDYLPSAFQVLDTHLEFLLEDDSCLVKSRIQFERKSGTQDLVLDGEDLELISVNLDHRKLAVNEYERGSSQLTVKNVPAKFVLETEVRIYPKKNTALEGLYQSGEVLLTQCEPQGFRRITYYLDRPDVMAPFVVRIEGDEKKHPVLLSNGDRIKSEKLPGGRHAATWSDPFKKPSYLFALVAGPLGVLKDEYTTGSGKNVNLEIYAAPKNLPRCHFAIESLKRAMKWDEERFGLEYDLSTYMIVSTDDFNAGAMENKGLNIFNSRLVLADPKTATDNNYFAIESVVAHEYFHNWTGNRVTLRDWFHLSLKEGLTVFRDQEYSMDQVSRDLVRIDDVVGLRESQFAEDAGPNAHPIRPESCYAVDNFFTSTIYEKGSEVIRMMQTMVGRPGFRKGMDLYFKRHDGQAVVIEDFAAAISEANGETWGQFKLWYSQAGTPRVKVEEKFDTNNGTYTLKLTQSCAPTPNQPVKKPFHIPLLIELLDSKGQSLEISHPDIRKNSEGKRILHLKNESQEYRITLNGEAFTERPHLSINREFSAPIVLDWSPTTEELCFLFGNDSDPFNRFEAGQKLMLAELKGFIAALSQAEAPRVQPALIEAQRQVLMDPKLDDALKARMLTAPSMSYLAQNLTQFDADITEKAFNLYRRQVAHALKDLAAAIYQKHHGKFDQRFDAEARGSRTLKNWALGRLCWAGEGLQLAQTQFSQTQIMTDQETALALLCSFGEGESALADFHRTWNADAVVMSRWWSVQASVEAPGTLEKVKALTQHPDFNIKNPNMVYALLGRFGGNLTRFHQKGGAAYQFFAEKLIEIDALNPQVAARLSSSFNFCPNLDLEQQLDAAKVLDGMLAKKLSPNSFEILSNARKALKI